MARTGLKVDLYPNGALPRVVVAAATYHIQCCTFTNHSNFGTKLEKCSFIPRKQPS